MEFHYVDLRCFCYSTESEERVLEALNLFLPPDTEVERDVTQGHHGNEIVVFSKRLENSDEIRYVMNKLLEADTIEEVKSQLDERVDPDCAFHIRIDKQAAYRGEVKIGEGITLRAKAEAYPAKHEKAVEAVRRSLFPESSEA